MTQNKYGFWVVIYRDKNGEQGLCSDYDDCGMETSQFNSEEAAEQFKLEMSKYQPHNYYYWKYIPWGEFA